MEPSLPNVVVLIVEDETLVRLYAAASFQDSGFTVIKAADGDEALEILEARSDIAAVFTDVNMPGLLDGVSLAREIGEQWPAVPVVVTSGKVTADTMQLPERGRYVAKP